MRKWIAVAAAGLVAACSSARKVEDGGTDGRPALAKLANGVVGYVVDTAGQSVANATVVLVPASSVPVDPLALTTIADERVSTQDEPLEDAIRAGIDASLWTTTNASGAYAIADVATGSYFLTVIPAVDDAEHLPGGDRCRTAVAETGLKNSQTDVTISTKPSASAAFVGPSNCLACHGSHSSAKLTLHGNGIRVTGSPAPTRFAEWNEALASFDAEGGTTLYYFDQSGTEWKVATIDPRPASTVSFTAHLYKDGSAYKVTLEDQEKGSGSATYTAELSYGGGLYKQRWVTKVGGTRYVLPIQYNFQGYATTETTEFTRWKWQHYNASHWFGAAGLKLPGANKSFDSMCAGCHFTGYELELTDAVGATVNKAHGVKDAAGDYDYDGNGDLEMMNLSCESCHGPGSEHVAAGGQGVAIVSPKLLTPEREVTICAGCHTRFVGAGGVRSGSALDTEAPLKDVYDPESGTTSSVMPRPGISRAEFLTNHISAMKDGLHSAATGDGLHASKHHQQASDFLKTRKYRNASQLLTCSTCHDVHGTKGNEHQLEGTVDAANSTAEGLCLGCHGTRTASLAGAGTIGERMVTHWRDPNADGVTTDGINSSSHSASAQITCTRCHMPKTAKSGSGVKGKEWSGTQYWQGDISSHLFRVPRVATIPVAGRTASMMPIPYTNACGDCHGTAPASK
jgi:hypothetical protein